MGNTRASRSALYNYVTVLDTATTTITTTTIATTAAEVMICRKQANKCDEQQPGANCAEQQTNNLADDKR